MMLGHASIAGRCFMGSMLLLFGSITRNILQTGVLCVSGQVNSRSLENLVMLILINKQNAINESRSDG